MLKVGVFCGLYLIQVFTYLLAYYVCFGVRRWSRLPVMAGGIVCFLMVLLIPVKDNEVWYLMVYVGALLTALAALWQMQDKPIKRYLELIFLVLCMGEVARVIWELLTMNSVVSASEDGEYAFIHLVPFVIILLAALGKYRMGVERLRRLKEVMQEHIVWLVAVIGIEMIVTVAALNWARAYVNNATFQLCALYVCGLAYVGICMQGGFSLYVAHANKRIEEAVKYEQQLKELQKQHYDMLLEREEDTRRYRHDMGNHLLCLQQRAEDGDLDAVREYLSGMLEQMESIQKRGYTTGNDVLDILTNHHVGRLGENVRVQVTGYLNEQVDNRSLCTIYGNLLQNAVEELMQCGGEAFLEISFAQGREHFEIAIRNSLSEVHKELELKDILKTQKGDKRAHGLGLLNVRETVETMGGRLEIRKEENTFCAIVTI